VRTSNLTTAPKYRPCPDGCGLTLLWSNDGRHPTPKDLEPEPLTPDPVEHSPLRDAVSQAQVRWAANMVAQYPKKPKNQIERENYITWAQLQHFAKTPLAGLPERVGQQQARAKKAPTKKAAKAKAAPRPEAKEA
jgi:hypothetical protein